MYARFWLITLSVLKKWSNKLFRCQMEWERIVVIIVFVDDDGDDGASLLLLWYLDEKGFVQILPIFRSSWIFLCIADTNSKFYTWPSLYTHTVIFLQETEFFQPTLILEHPLPLSHLSYRHSSPFYCSWISCASEKQTFGSCKLIYQHSGAFRKFL